MPAATNLIVKNNAGTDKTFTLIAPASGYGGIAEWVLKEGAVSGAFPRITWSGIVTPRGNNANFKFRYPSSYVDVATGLTVIGETAEVNAKFTMPSGFPEDKKDDYIAFALNALKTALLTACGRDAHPAT